MDATQNRYLSYWSRGGIVVHTTELEEFSMIEVTVDFARCDANGTCAALVPDVFRIGSDGLLELVTGSVDDDREGDVEEAILCCPVGAISRS
ncbi:ferredoxin [Blastococcus sp. SYSU D00820]